MKKILLMILILFSFTQITIASQISYDKSDFAPVYTVIDDAAYDIRYYSSNNFTGNRINGYKAPVAYMTKEALQALSVAAEDLRKQGYRLLIWDTYRPQKAVYNFVEWINDPDNDGDKSFYPTLKKSDLLKGQYIMEKSGHTRGSTVDLTLIKKDGSFVDMGGTFDLFSEISHPDYKKLTREQKKNRKILHDAMVKAGFNGLDSEWWHFTLKNEPYPDTYFDFDVE
ncbi:MAG: M15 family metallopeptidase [Candidatus Gastranaerophilaceae bacterium]|jgi:D-alanyl-D-alanine dipeptidase|nr:M15 family metallopeptidase [Candidatus Gastranaerophilaceae bacterium]